MAGRVALSLVRVTVARHRRVRAPARACLWQAIAAHTHVRPTRLGMAGGRSLAKGRRKKNRKNNKKYIKVLLKIVHVSVDGIM